MTFNGENLGHADHKGTTLSPRDRIVKSIPVENFIFKFNVDNPLTKEVLREFPMLCYLLGNVKEAYDGNNNRIIDERPDKVQRQISFLTEGSALFGLKDPEDAMRWKGIFNHAVGTARQVFYLTQRLSNLTDDQKQKFAEKGFDVASFENLDPELLGDFMTVSHAGRRYVDESNWHGIVDKAHHRDEHGKVKTSGVATLDLLKSYNADPVLLDLMRVENHAELLATSTSGDQIFPNAEDNILTYCDWTFNQKPVTLKKRFEEFEGTPTSKPTSSLPKNQLNTLKICGMNFEKAIKEILGENIYEEMANAGPYDWETKIRKAYCSPSGINLEQAFPFYTAQFPQVLQS